MATLNKPKSALTLTLPSDKEVLITREIAAPPRLVFGAYTDRDIIPSWWGPRGTATRVDKLDLRPGGVWRFINIAADGQEHAFNGVYKEIVPGERLVYTFEYEPMAGHILTESITFEDRGNSTLIVNRSAYASKEDRDGMLASGMEQGASETMDRLEERVAARNAENVFSRVFDAPRKLVFEAWSTPAHLARWFGPKDFTSPVAEMDFRAGGAIRHCLRGPDGQEYWHRGRYLEVTPPEKIVFTATLDAVPEPHEILTTVLFAEKAGKTEISIRQAYFNLAEDVPSGSLEGWLESFDKLDRVLAGKA